VVTRGGTTIEPVIERVRAVAEFMCGFLTLAFLAAFPRGAFASTLSPVSIQYAGSVAEMRFHIDGEPPPRLSVVGHGQELWIELPGVQVEVPPRPLFGRESPPIKTVRALDLGGGHARIVVEVAGSVDYAIARNAGDYTLRLAPANTVANLAAGLLRSPSRPSANASPHPARTATQVPADPHYAELSRPPDPEISTDSRTLPAHPLVMIDPGHGGYDPGTRSSTGLSEKDLALEISSRLASALRARGIRADLTRDNDVFLPLSERTARANGANADLFVSIHLNSSPNTATTGIEVYYLNNTTDRATIRLARMENQGRKDTGVPADANLNYILADLRQSYKAAEAAALAEEIDADSTAAISSQLGIEERMLGAKRGPFYVLVGAHMPAVLVECGFLSNDEEAARLESSQYQQVLANAAAGAIVRHLKTDMTTGNL